MNIIKNEEQIKHLKNDFISYFQAKSLSLILGAGFSAGSFAKNGTVPNSNEMKRHMISELRKSSEIPFDENLENYSFKEICSFFENNKYVGNSERTKYYADNFSEVSIPEKRKKILKIDWSYVYTFNIDDGIERNSEFNHPVIANNAINDEVYKNYKCVIKLHGDIHDIVTNQNPSSKIFTTDEYLHSIKTNKSLLDKLENDYRYQNVLFFGCSLDEELDLQTFNIPVSEIDEKRSRRFLFACKEPNFRNRTLLENAYKITDVIVIPNFDEWYDFLTEAWDESQKVKADLLEAFENVPKKELEIGKKNEGYFYFGKSLFNSKTKEIVYPYFFIHRDITNSIIELLLKNTVVLIQGRAVSGRSYFLADINYNLPGKSIYFFGGFTRLSDEAVNKIIAKRNVISLFDINTLSRPQLERILGNADAIHKNESSIVVMLSYNDSDSMGIVKFKLQNHEIRNENIKIRNLPYKYSLAELKSLNPKLTALDIPVFSSTDTVLGNLVSAEQKLLKNGKYSPVNLNIKSVFDVVVYIILATNGKIYSSEMVKFGIAAETVLASKEYEIFIEEISTDLLEKDPSDMSNKKYVLNAELWLRNQLSAFAEKQENYDFIIEAYFHIVSKILETQGDLKREREKYRKYIYFDSINNIFVGKSKNNLQLIIEIYEKLNSLLSQDYNFLHQFAKGYLNKAQFLKANSNKNERYKNFESAYKKIIVAESLIDDAIKQTTSLRGRADGKDFKLITRSHILFTKALTLSGLCLTEELTGEKNIEKALSAIDEALMDKENFDNNLRFGNGSLIQEFVKECVDNSMISSNGRKITSKILTKIMKFSKKNDLSE